MYIVPAIYSLIIIFILYTFDSLDSGGILIQ